MEKSLAPGRKKGAFGKGNGGTYALLGIISAVWLLPFVLLLLQSFRGESGGQVNYIFPRQWTLDNYRFLFQGAAFRPEKLMDGLPAMVTTLVLSLICLGAVLYFLFRRPKNPLEKRKGRLSGSLMTVLFFLLILFMRSVDARNCDFVQWFLNTLTIALFCAAIQTLLVLFVAYTFSRIRFKGRRLMMNVVLVLGMFPGFLTMIVLYYLLKTLGLTQSGAVPGLILISCASSGMGYYIAKGFFDTIPKSLDESARMDGAARYQVFGKIILPMAKPIVIYTVLMGFMGPWGDYVFASYVAFGHKSSYNVAVGLYRWVNTNDYQGYFTRFCAGGVLVAIPITILFLCLQKYYVEGITGGAVKG